MEDMKIFELAPIDGRKSFNGKCKVMTDGKTATLYSYDVKIMALDLATGAITTTKYYDFSDTTKRHQKAFRAFYNI